MNMKEFMLSQNTKTDTETSKLQKIKNTGNKILTRQKKKYDHIISGPQGPPLVRKRMDFKILMLTYKYLNDLTPSYLAKLLECYEPSGILRSGNQLNLKVSQDLSQLLW